MTTLLCTLLAIAAYCFALLLAMVFLLPLAAIVFSAAAIVVAVSRKLNLAMNATTLWATSLFKKWLYTYTYWQQDRKLLSGFDKNNFTTIKRLL